MKFWRNFSIVAVVVAMTASTALAGRGTLKKCEINDESAPAFPFVMAGGFQEDGNVFVGNQFPWETGSTLFTSYRNTYRYPAAVIATYQAAKIESIHARTSSFSSGGTSGYGSGVVGGKALDSFIEVRESLGPLVTTFSLNFGGTVLGGLSSTSGACPANYTCFAGPIRIGTHIGPGGANLSDCLNCPGTGGDFGTRNAWFTAVDATAPPNGVIMDHQNAARTENSGGPIWDTHGGDAVTGGERAFGSGAFANPNHLTTALAVDTFDFVWVSKGAGLPQPATIAMQIGEIIRLLLTPNGLRCSGLDLNSGNGKIEDNPVAWNDGALIDPISPQIRAGGGGGIVTGDETKDSPRSQGW